MKLHSMYPWTTALVLAFCQPMLSGATIDLNILPSTNTDQAIGVSTSNTYTHAFNFAEGASSTLNGVTFTQAFPSGDVASGISTRNSATQLDLVDATSGLPLTVLRGENNGNGFQGIYSDVLVPGFTTLADGDSKSFFNSFGIVAGGSGNMLVGSFTTFTIGGLTPGEDYIARIYGESWSDAPDTRELTIGSEAASLLVDWSDPGNTGSNVVGTVFYVEVSYTAVSATHDVTITINDAGNGAHMSGFSNQLATVPEPAHFAVALGLMVSVGCFMRRRLRR